MIVIGPLWIAPVIWFWNMMVYLLAGTIGVAIDIVSIFIQLIVRLVHKAQGAETAPLVYVTPKVIGRMRRTRR